MFTKCFATACCIVSAYSFFVPQIAISPSEYSPRKRQWSEIADEYTGLRKRNKCLVRAVVKVESNNCKLKFSSAGALGCTQLMPRTAKAYGLRSREEILEDEFNLPIGIKHLYELIDRHGLFKGLQIYNAGPRRVGMTKENRDYPHKVFSELVRCQDTVNDKG